MTGNGFYEKSHIIVGCREGHKVLFGQCTVIGGSLAGSERPKSTAYTPPTLIPPLANARLVGSGEAHGNSNVVGA